MSYNKTMLFSVGFIADNAWIIPSISKSIIEMPIKSPVLLKIHAPAVVTELYVVSSM